MRPNILFLCLFLLLSISGQAQKYRTEIFSDQVKTLRVNLVDNWEAPPIIPLEGDDWVEVSFDLLGAKPERLTYTLTHCDAEWRKSQLIESEYMNGFQNNLIEDYANSFNTTMDYVNYRLTFPNENIYLKISGNYVVQVFVQGDNFPLLTACFSVIETEASIGMEITSLTDKGMNSKFQAVNFEVAYGNDVRTPTRDLKVFVRQNYRLDNEAKLVQPLSFGNQRLVYQHNPSLIFDAGNEYRSFEMTTNRYNGLNVEAIEYHSPYYHVILKPGGFRTFSYSYNEDINGRFYIRTLQGTDFDLESDYRFVHFFLPCKTPLKEDVHILSGIFHNILDERSQMEYSEVDEGYIKTLLLKEGYYNYQYVTKKNADSPGSPDLIEGSFYQAENEYQIYVYFRPMGGRYDKLIAYKNLRHR
jgi:hypothetical protein